MSGSTAIQPFDTEAAATHSTVAGKAAAHAARRGTATPRAKPTTATVRAMAATIASNAADVAHRPKLTAPAPPTSTTDAAMIHEFDLRVEPTLAIGATTASRSGPR